MDALIRLKIFWIAANNIETIRTSLDKLKSLIELNIAGNRIRSFKELLNLNRLPQLKTLSFYDPHFGENPVCSLANY